MADTGPISCVRCVAWAVLFFSFVHMVIAGAEIYLWSEWFGKGFMSFFNDFNNTQFNTSTINAATNDAKKIANDVGSTILNVAASSPREAIVGLVWLSSVPLDDYSAVLRTFVGEDELRASVLVRHVPCEPAPRGCRSRLVWVHAVRLRACMERIVPHQEYRPTQQPQVPDASEHSGHGLLHGRLQWAHDHLLSHPVVQDLRGEVGGGVGGEAAILLGEPIMDDALIRLLVPHGLSGRKATARHQNVGCVHGNRTVFHNHIA